MLKKKILGALLLIFSWARTDALDTHNPVQMLENITQSVMVEIKKNVQTLKYDPDEIYPVFNQLIFPHVDFAEMAHWVVGRNAWYATDNETRIAFIDVFKRFIVKNYVHFLVKFRNEAIQFFPLRENDAQAREIQINSEIQRQGESPIQVTYRLIRQQDGWKVYDIVVEGSSLIQGYQAQFADTVESGGVSALVARIQQNL